MSIEQNLNQNSQEEIKNNEVTKEVSPVEVVSDEDKVIKAEENNKKIEEKKEEIIKQFSGQEVKKEFSEVHIMNPQILNKIAQLEAIDPNTLEFNQNRYDDYMNSEKQRGDYSVTENQKKIQQTIDNGGNLEDSYWDAEVIYGQGGWNRYPVNTDTGEVFLARGAGITTGSPEYKTKLAEKAKELGIKVDGQE